MPRQVASMVIPLASLAFALIFFVALCWIFLAFDRPSMLMNVIYAICGLVGGAGAGFAIGRAWKTEI